jgi:hypothetical protein
VNRKLTAGALLGLLLALCSYSSFTARLYFPYAGEGEILEEPGEHVGEKVLICGWVVGADENRALVSIGWGEVEVLGLSAVEGERVEVFGVLVDNTTIALEKAVIYPALDYYSMFARSLAGAGVLLVLFLRYWRLRRWRVVEV